MRLAQPSTDIRLARRLNRSTTASVSPGLQGASATPDGSGGAVTNGTTYRELVPCAASSRLRVRLLTVTATGTLNVKLVAPIAASITDESATAASGFVDPAKVTAYPTGSGSVSVSAGTEAKVDVDLYGENYALIEFVCSLNGIITYCDVSQV